MKYLSVKHKTVAQRSCGSRAFQDRLAGRLLDYCIWGGLAFALSKWLGRFIQLSENPNLFPALLHAGFGLLYYPVLEATGGTIGKRLMGLRTTSAADPRLNLSAMEALLKTATQFAPMVAFYYFVLFADHDHLCAHAIFECTIFLAALLALAPLSILFSNTHCALHDRWSRSRVIHKTAIVPFSAEQVDVHQNVADIRMLPALP